MSWHYASKRVEEGGNVWYELHEVYPDLTQRLGSEELIHTELEAIVRGDTKKELAEMLRQAADDVEYYPVIKESEDES